MDQYIHNGNPGRRREEGAERLFEEIMADNFPGLRKVMNINTKKISYSNRKHSKRSTPRHNLSTLLKDKEGILKSAREKRTCRMQAIHNKVNGRFLIRNFGGHKTVSQYIQNTEKKNYCQSKKPISGKIDFQR